MDLFISCSNNFRCYLIIPFSSLIKPVNSPINIIYKLLYFLISCTNNVYKMKTKNYPHKFSVKQNFTNLRKLANCLFSSKLLHFYGIVYLHTFGIYLLLGGTVVDSKMQLKLTLCLFCLEIGHGFLHLKVIFVFGNMARETDYEENRSYFIIDGLSFLVSYLCLRSFSPDSYYPSWIY